MEGYRDKERKGDVLEDLGKLKKVGKMRIVGGWKCYG